MTIVNRKHDKRHEVELFSGKNCGVFIKILSVSTIAAIPLTCQKVPMKTIQWKFVKKFPMCCCRESCMYHLSMQLPYMPALAAAEMRWLRLCLLMAGNSHLNLLCD
jgi:hypothetical protein